MKLKLSQVAGLFFDIPAFLRDHPNLTVVASIMLASTQAIADEPGGTQYYLSGNLMTGFVSTSPAEPDCESEKSGYTLAAGGVLTFYTKSLAMDAGLGVYSGSVTGSVIKQPSGCATADNERIEFTTASVIISPKWRLTESMELGPILLTTAGADASYSPDLDADTIPRFYGGLQLAHSWADPMAYNLRVGLYGMFSLNNGDRAVSMFGVSATAGIPLTKPQTIVQTKVEYKTRTRTKTVEKVVYQPIYVFQTHSINFETDSSNLTRESEAFVYEIGASLSESRDAWEVMEIGGHTDKTGSDEKNVRLSQERAESVKRALIQKDIPEGRISAKGYGSSMPLVEGEDSVSLAKNRRVEISFSGSFDQTRLGPVLDKIRRKYERPLTCGDKDSCK
jgi:outer membrane protein OmpA-like peptidoglycan-associated protein